MIRFGPKVAVAWAAVCVLLTLVYARQLSPGMSSACLAVVSLGSIVCLLLGPWLHRPRPVLPWRLLCGAAGLFLIGILVRPVAADAVGLQTWISSGISLAGYAALICSLVVLNRSNGPLERHALADGTIVSLGTGLVATIVLALPAVEISDRPIAFSLLAGLFPVIDVVLLLLLLNLAFTTATELPSYRYFVLAMICLFAGDLGYAWIGRTGQIQGSALLDVPFLLSYICFGLAAVHPSMAKISGAIVRPVQAWSRRRLVLIIPALLAPAAVVAVARDLTLGARLVLAVGFAGLVLTLLFRAVSAVHSLAGMQEVFRHQARHDALTDLPNRAELMEQLVQLQTSRRGDDRSVWVLLLDLDRFKLVNDSWGHETGDELLLEVARRLRQITGGFTRMARVGGDEFVISGLLTREQAIEIARRIQLILHDPIDVAGLDLVLTASIGMAEAGPGTDPQVVVRDADTAMYRAKGHGRNGWVIFDESMRQPVQDRVEIERALREAVRRAQLWIAYQPIVDLVSEQVVGAEALLRWTHPVRGDISPVEFIPIAEETGMIIEIGAWVLTESVRQLADWQQRGLVRRDFFMSVNASTRQLRDHDLGKLIGDLLAETGITPSQLVIEITESVMMESQRASEILTALRELGVRLSVDDFGTGYSSLSYLSRYPVTGVKIDRAFVDGLGDAIGDEADGQQSADVIAQSGSARDGRGNAHRRSEYQPARLRPRDES
jgi:diguanylate cyclase